MMLKKINLDTVVIKENLGRGEKFTLKEMIMSLILIVIAIYFSTTAWIILMRGSSDKLNTQSLLLLSAIVSIIFQMIYFILRFPIVLFLSKLNKTLLYLPIKPHNILLTRYRYLLFIQFIISVIVTIPLLFLTSLNFNIYISFLIYLTLVIIGINYTLIIVLFIIGYIVSKKYIQIALISTSLFSGFIMSIFLKYKGINIVGNIINKFINSKSCIHTLTMFSMIICIVVVLHGLIILICDKWFKNIYYKTLFSKVRDRGRKKVYNIHNPYIFLEIRFILRNKSFLIYSVLKALFLMYIMLKLITKSIIINNDIQIMLSIIFISSFNSISITAISRDLKQIKIMRTMPIDFKKMIFSKIIVSTIINFGLCLLLLILLKVKSGIPVIPYILFNIVYSSFSSIIGVYLDLATPNDSYDNLNDLIRNNSGTMIQFFIAIMTLVTISILRIYFECYFIIINIILLSISALIIKYKKVMMV